MEVLIKLFLPAIFETFYMVFVSTFFTIIFGLILGIILTVTSKNSIMENKIIYSMLSYIVNIIRSLPFIILLVFLIPFTRFISGSAIGTKSVVIPLVIASVPFFARLVETSLLEVDKGVIEAGISMGATNFEIITKIMIPEALGQLILNITVLIINILGYSAMAGSVGGGGLGALALRFGLYKNDMKIMSITIIILIIFVQIVQFIGNFFANKFNR